MKLITLNLWGGRIRKPLLDFINIHRNVDIFCFQEVYYNAHRTVTEEDRELSLNIFSDLQQLLPNHFAIFKPAVENIYGIAMLLKNNIDILGEGDITIHQKQHYPGIGANHPRNLQWVECEVDKKIYSILNVHGLWNGQGKNDTPERINQSQRIRHFMDTINTPKILCGDFNLRPDTKSMHILERKMNNLIKINNVSSTRTSYYKKEEKFADYILTSPDIIVNEFSVLSDEVSDHAPLYIDFN
ncbi:endonuclease/exonuclease/phosphatase family protein [Fluoribacter gormanii]|uniref:endonuclease/exonuclease/phosphatase family protein n=1 Tax=Fluoribacter gormanii TaxID=464 RepID=UPI0010414F91|nr:endonuclease/exonuclease/phosphatase family protein [Fluoribacter gormanii]